MHSIRLQFTVCLGFSLVLRPQNPHFNTNFSSVLDKAKLERDRSQKYLKKLVKIVTMVVTQARVPFSLHLIVLKIKM